jgi:hypothetical protein
MLVTFATCRSLCVILYADNAVRFLGDGRLVSYQYDGMTAVVEPAEGLHDDVTGSSVEISRRLVGQDQGRIIDEGAGNRDTLDLPSGELIGEMRPVSFFQSGATQGRFGAFFAFVRETPAYTRG